VTSPLERIVDITEPPKAATEEEFSSKVSDVEPTTIYRGVPDDAVTEVNFGAVIEERRELARGVPISTVRAKSLNGENGPGSHMYAFQADVLVPVNLTGTGNQHYVLYKHINDELPPDIYDISTWKKSNREMDFSLTDPPDGTGNAGPKGKRPK